MQRLPQPWLLGSLVEAWNDARGTDVRHISGCAPPPWLG